jgi:hypothetical protein
VIYYSGMTVVRRIDYRRASRLRTNTYFGAAARPFPLINHWLGRRTLANYDSGV